MPRDSRLYMTFPIDFHRHPKLQKLPVDVRWTFVEMNGEARLADNDGTFDEDDAEFMWPLEHLDALVRSHPTRPLVLHENGCYVIRDYAEHQETRASREERSRRNTENGRKGGRPPKNRPETDPVPSRFPFGTEPQPTETHTKAESESESEDSSKTSESQSSSNRARVSTDAIPVSAMTKRLADQRGITSLRSVVDAIGRHCAVTVTADQAFQVSVWLLDKAKTSPAAPQRYVTAAIAKSPAEVQQHIYESMEVA